MASSNPIRFLLSLVLLLLAPLTLAQNTTSSASATATVTRIVEIFYINERAHEGLPYTLSNQVSGSVLNVDAAANLTTFVITTTRTDRPGRPFASTSSSETASVPTETLTPAPTFSRTRLPGGGGGGGGDGDGGGPHGKFNNTGQPTTITQGPNTFLFTGTRYGPNHSIINRCTLNGTVSANCNMTYLGTAWYTRDSKWNGTFSTYSYNWTSGDRFGWAPVTITAGAELLVGEGPGKPTPSSGGGASPGLPSSFTVNAVISLALGLSVLVGLGIIA